VSSRFGDVVSACLEAGLHVLLGAFEDEVKAIWLA
jgi:hypothetical protein